MSDLRLCPRVRAAECHTVTPPRSALAAMPKARLGGVLSHGRGWVTSTRAWRHFPYAQPQSSVQSCGTTGFMIGAYFYWEEVRCQGGRCWVQNFECCNLARYNSAPAAQISSSKAQSGPDKPTDKACGIRTEQVIDPTMVSANLNSMVQPVYARGGSSGFQHRFEGTFSKTACPRRSSPTSQVLHPHPSSGPTRSTTTTT
jgi:hypothetical protein